MGVKGANCGEKNGNWGGGLSITTKGYKIRLSHGHPRADKNGYVYEHILVMEGKIGRKVKLGEVVHHIDHNKLNNSPENLKLFNNHAEHLIHEADERGRKVKDVLCDTCGKSFKKDVCRIKRFNFCSRKHINPLIYKTYVVSIA